ncbi:hypothetical protein BC937DRAFT_93169 [Endogone sp. FLAS-F59071]|nr:hypothetical protein BC937DRAFT_93169 [Endogone sp. FLAS-F59071]|eukprot:RUS14909.1 hypothetical protein BC937DRAFT_93169 [Endogone sp. FLAS-F59071]
MTANFKKKFLVLLLHTAHTAHNALLSACDAQSALLRSSKLRQCSRVECQNLRLVKVVDNVQLAHGSKRLHVPVNNLEHVQLIIRPVHSHRKVEGGVAGQSNEMMGKGLDRCAQWAMGLLAINLGELVVRAR